MFKYIILKRYSCFPLAPFGLKNKGNYFLHHYLYKIQTEVLISTAKQKSCQNKQPFLHCCSFLFHGFITDVIDLLDIALLAKFFVDDGNQDYLYLVILSDQKLENACVCGNMYFISQVLEFLNDFSLVLKTELLLFVYSLMRKN